MSNINKQLTKDATRAGICAEWHKRMAETTDFGEFMNMYYKGIDFCIKNKFPTLEYIRKNLKGKTESYGGFIDEEMRVESLKYSVARGTTRGTAVYKNFDVCRIFLFEDSEVEVHVSGNAFVMVDLYDNAKVSIIATDEGKATVMQHGGEVNIINDNGKIKILKK